MDLDSLDIGARALINHEGDIGTACLGVAHDPRLGMGKGKATLRHLACERFAGLVEQAGVECRAGAGEQQAMKLVAIESGDVADDADLAEIVTLALVDRKVNFEAVACRIIFGICGGHGRVGVAVVLVVLAYCLAVVIDPVGVVDIPAGQEAQHVRDRGLDDRPELAISEDMVAGKGDRLHRRLLAFGDSIDEVDPVIAAIDDLRRDANTFAAGPMIGFDDAIDIALHSRTRQSATRLGLDDGRQIGILDFLVAFEGNSIEHLGFHHVNDDVLTRALDPDVIELPRRGHLLQGFVKRGGIVAPGIVHMEIAAHGVGVDATIALDANCVLRRC
jgi:hypothetical protein